MEQEQDAGYSHDTDGENVPKQNECILRHCIGDWSWTCQRHHQTEFFFNCSLIFNTVPIFINPAPVIGNGYFKNLVLCTFNQLRSWDIRFPITIPVIFSDTDDNHGTIPVTGLSIDESTIFLLTDISNQFVLRIWWQFPDDLVNAILRVRDCVITNQFFVIQDNIAGVFCKPIACTDRTGLTSIAHKGISDTGCTRIDFLDNRRNTENILDVVIDTVI